MAHSEEDVPRPAQGWPGAPHVHANDPPPWPVQPPGWGPAPPPPGAWTSGWGPQQVLPKGGGARTGPLPLHPMTLGDILDGSFKLLKANLRTALLITALFVLPLNVLSAFFQRGALPVGLLDALNDPSLMEATGAGPSAPELVGLGLTLLASAVATPFVAGAISRVVAASYLGEQLEAGPALRATGRRLWSLLGSWVLVHLVEGAGLLVAVVLLVAILPLAGAGSPLAALAAVGLVLGGLLAALALMAPFVAVAPAIVVEELGPLRGMRRSWRLLVPRYWAVLGIALLSGLVSSLLGSVLGAPFALAAVLLGYGVGWPLLALGSVLPAMVTTPFVAVVATLVYFDGRIRQEGFDLQVIAADLAAGGVGSR